MKKGRHIEEQKGPINPAPKTYRTMTHSERLKERAQEIKETRKGQTCDYVSPQKNRK